MGITHVTGPVPGPNSRALAERRARAVTNALSTVHPIFLERASGTTVTDVDGNTYLDFAGGIGVMNVGHTRREVVAAIAATTSGRACPTFMTPMPPAKSR